MPRRDRREFHPFVVILDGQEYEVHPDRKVYHRRPRQRLRCLHKLTETFRTEEATLHRVKDAALIQRAHEKAQGVSWTRGVGVPASEAAPRRRWLSTIWPFRWWASRN